MTVALLSDDEDDDTVHAAAMTFFSDDTLFSDEVTDDDVTTVCYDDEVNADITCTPVQPDDVARVNVITFRTCQADNTSAFLFQSSNASPVVTSLQPYATTALSADSPSFEGEGNGCCVTEDTASSARSGKKDRKRKRAQANEHEPASTFHKLSTREGSPVREDPLDKLLSKVKQQLEEHNARLQKDGYFKSVTYNHEGTASGAPSRKDRGVLYPALRKILAFADEILDALNCGQEQAKRDQLWSALARARMEKHKMLKLLKAPALIAEARGLLECRTTKH